MARVTETEINELLHLYRSGNADAGEKLLSGLRPLVKAMVRRFTGNRYEADDLEQVGYIGLLKAIERYDPSAGARLTTYAVKWITGEIQMYLRRGHHNLMKVRPQSTEDSLSELAARTGVSREEAAVSTEYRNQIILPGDEKMALIASEESCEEDIVRNRWLKEALLTLPPTERKVIFYRYFEEKTQQEVADLLGLTQKQVSRLEIRVLKKMKQTLQD